MVPTSANTARTIAGRILRGADDILDTALVLNPGDARADHLRPIAEYWAGVMRGEEMRLVLSAAPRMGKSRLNCVGAAEAMLCRPGLRLILVCATQGLADELSRTIRTYAEMMGLQIQPDQRSVGRWAATNGSECRAYGLEASLVGVAADVLLVDDLLPSMASANSATEREKVDNFFRAQAIARMQPGASCIVLFHRWTDDDQIQKLIDRGWPHVNVPACDPVTGESTFPALWSTEQLRQKERDVGPLLWEAQYMGMPAARGGSVFGAAVTTYDQLKIRAQLEAKTAQICLACDPAATAKTHADYSVIMAGAVTYENDELILNIIDCWRGQVEIPDLVDLLIAKQRAYARLDPRGIAPLGIESVAGFKGVAQLVHRANPTLQVLPLRPITDKLTRSIPCQALWASGRIRWPQSAPWLQQALAEVRRFTGLPTTGNEHDDVPDCMVMLAQMTIGVHNAEISKRRVARIARMLPFG